jgi:hypothetical protein
LQDVPISTLIVPTVSTKPTTTVSRSLMITPTSSSTPQLALTKTITSTPDSIYLTEEAAVSSCAATERSWYSKYLSAAYFTNELWNAVICSDKGIYTKIWNESLGLNWTLPAVSDDLSGNEPVWYWVPNRWSEDGMYLYLEPACLCSIDSPWLIYSSGYGLSRLNLNTGLLDVWLKPNDVGYSFEFSQDGSLFAFLHPDLLDIIKIRNLITGDEQSLAFKEKYTILEFRWSLDNSRLIIFTEEHEANSSESGFSIFVYTVRSEILRKLIDKDTLGDTFPTEDYSGPRIFISSLSENILTLSDVFGEVEFQLNIETNELIKVNN